MTDKSYVAMEHHICPVCGVEFATEAILIDKRLKKSMEPSVVTGLSLCPKHDQLHLDGFVAFVEVDETKSDVTRKLNPTNAFRTGTIIHIKRGAARQVFTADMHDHLDEPFVYCGSELINLLTSLQEPTPA
jgi:hypothetical protein